MKDDTGERWERTEQTGIKREETEEEGKEKRRGKEVEDSGHK